MEYTGSCHCGRVAYRVEGEIGQVLDCNCSLCRKRGGLLWFVPRDALSLTGEVTASATYTFNTHRIQHHFCTTCGIAPYSEGQNPDGSAMACINVRCLDGVDLAKLQIVQYDGASR
jgi:hypothetical protein